jgi:hypothetical protein
MSNHSSAFVPIEAWPYSSPDVFDKKQPVDMGLFCEALIYYDKLYININTPEQLASFTVWFYKYRNEKLLLELIRQGIINIYEYSFISAAVDVKGEYYDILNIKDPHLDQPNSFFERHFEHYPALRNAISDKKFRNEFQAALEGHVIEKKSDHIGAYVTQNASLDYRDADKVALMLQVLVDEIYRLRGHAKAPQIKVGVEDNKNGTVTLHWNININILSEIAGPRFNITPAAPLTAGVISNRFIWSASDLKCDLYLGEPISMLVGNKLFEAAKVTKIGHVISSLQQEVEFPNIRRLVNNDKVDLRDVLRYRDQGSKFRRWLQEEGERDRNAIIAYHNEVARQTGLSKFAPSALNMFGAIGGSMLGAYAGDSISLAGAVGAGGYFLSSIASQLASEWKPVVFGKWLQEDISRILDK